MKKQIFILLAFIISTTALAQGGFTNYKAVITDGGTPLANHAVTVRFTVLHGATQVFQETQTTTTDANGIITLNIGEANPTPWFAIQWKQLGFSLKTEYDTGSGFVDMGTQDFRFMPYAQHARTAYVAEVADEVDFNNITNVPAGLSDGDDDTQLTEAQVDNYVANNGYATELNDLSDAKTIYSSVYVGRDSGTNDVGIETIGAGTAQTANTGLGKYALKEITNGRRNVAIGDNALKNNVSGGFNVGLGSATLISLTSGNGNVAVGEFAGRTTNGSGNIFIGNLAGYNESGSNKLYIENSSSSTPLIGGDFNTDEVTINGTLKITGGTPGSGKVFTSDINGKGSWQTPVDNDTHLTEAQVDNYVSNNGYLQLDPNDNISLDITNNSTSSLATGININMNTGNSTKKGINIKFEGTTTLTSGISNGYMFRDETTSNQNLAASYHFFVGTNTSTSSRISGLFNTFSNSSNYAGTLLGVSNAIYSNQDGKMYGVSNYISGSGTGNKYGTYNYISQSSGGTHYAVYAKAEKTGSYAGYFIGKVAIIDGTQGDGKILVSDANGIASWGNTLPKQTYKINYAANNFTVFSNSDEYKIGFDYAYIKSTATTTKYLMLPINLPEGAEITNIKIYYKDNSSSNLEFDLKIKSLTSISSLSVRLGTSNEEDNNLHTFEYIPYIPISTDKTYTLAIKNIDGAWGTTGNIRIYSVSITYEK